MTIDAPRASLRPAGTGPETALARCIGPAWVIDPAKGRVLAANAAGAARMGLHPDAACGTLDASMPGLVRLRALVREPLNGGRREPLIFWTAYGAESLDCTVRTIPEQPSSGLVLVAIAGIGERENAITEAKLEAPVKAPPPEPADGSPSAGDDDAATLKRIAHAIRTGFGKPAAPQPLADDEPETAAASQAEREAHVSKLAHELRTPLSAIMLAAEIMKDQRFGKITNPRYRGYTKDIHDNALHALAVVDRLLGNDAPQDDGADRLDAVELNLNTITERSVSAMRPLADEAELSLKFERHARLPKVIADAMSVKQILFNLLANAIKFTPAKGEIRVVTGLGYEGGVFIAVKDTGRGMTAKAIARALDTDAKPERTQAGGHGIGLPLAANLAAANGARLEIDSAPGEGTAVALVFPEACLAKNKERSSSN